MNYTMLFFYRFLFIYVLLFGATFFSINAQNLSNHSCPELLEKLDSLGELGIMNSFQEMHTIAKIGIKRSVKENGEESINYASFCTYMGIGYSGSWMYDSAMFYLEKAKVIFERKDTENFLYGRTLIGINNIYNHQLIPFDKSEDYIRRSIKIIKRTKGECSIYYFSTVHYLGIHFFKRSVWDSAQIYFSEALNSCSNCNNKKGIDCIHSKIMLATIFKSKQRLILADSILEICHKDILESESTNSEIYLDVLIKLAGIKSYLNENILAEKLYLKALSESKRLINILPLNRGSYNYWVSFINTGVFYLKMEQYNLAKEYLITSTKGFQSHRLYPMIYYYLGRVYEGLKMYEISLNYLDRALNLYKKMSYYDQESYLRINSLRGVLYMKIGHNDKAIVIHKGVLDSIEIIYGKDYYGYHAVKLELIKTYIRSEKYNLALMECQSLMIDSLLPSSQINLTNLFARIYCDINKLDSAYFFLNKAILLNSVDSQHTPLTFFSDISFLKNLKFIDYQSLFYTLNLLYKIRQKELQLVKTVEVEKKYKEEIYELLKLIIFLDRNHHAGLIESKDIIKTSVHDSIYAKGITMALALGKPELAFPFIETRKTTILRNIIKGNKLRQLGNIPDSLLLKERQLIAENSFSNINKDGLIQAEKNIALAKIKNLIREEFPEYYKLKYQSELISISQIQEKLDTSSLLLEYFVLDSLVYLFAINKNKYNLYILSTYKEELSSQIILLRRMLTDIGYIKQSENQQECYKDYTEVAHWFYKKLLEPAIIDMGGQEIRHLNIITDKELGQVPFEVFLMSPAPKRQTYTRLKYLIKKYSVSYNYSATLWGQYFDYEQKKGKGILVAAASYEKDRELPMGQTEFRTLRKIFKDDGLFFYGKEANERTFKKNVKYRKLIHLIMHGTSNLDNPVLSSLIFTNTQDSLEDNNLQAWEISKLDLNADLVVLSACETGYGNFVEGEGIISLTRAFMYAGVPSLVVSLWQTNDESTAELMPLFYNCLLKKGTEKSEALQIAKLKYIEKEKDYIIDSHPYYWSQFVLIGPKRALSF